MKKILSKILFASFTVTVMIAAGLTACTKADYSDGFTPSSPPPIGNYKVSDDVAKDALVAKWGFENSYNDSIQKLTGVNSHASFSPGYKGLAYQGNDTSYVVYKQPGTIPALKAFTLSFWMKAPQTSGKARGIFSLSNQQDFWGCLDVYMENFSSPDTANFKVHIGSNINGNNVGQFIQTYIPKAIKNWVNVIISYDSGSSIFNIYANSQQLPINVGSQQNVKGPVLGGATPGTTYGPLDFIHNNATAIVIGTWQFQPNDPYITVTGSQSWAGSFAGQLDQFRIYNRALTAKEADALFRLEKLGL